MLRVKSDTSTSRPHDSLLLLYPTLLLRISSLTLRISFVWLSSCTVDQCASLFLWKMCEWIDDWLNGGLENTSHVGTATTFAQEKTLPTCNVLSDLRIPHHVSPLQKVEEAENTLGKTTNFKCFSWISCNGSHVKVQVSADSVRYSDIPMTIFAPPITGQSSQDLCLEWFEGNFPEHAMESLKSISRSNNLRVLFLWPAGQPAITSVWHNIMKSGYLTKASFNVFIIIHIIHVWNCIRSLLLGF